jgi:hypothetical protein
MAHLTLTDAKLWLDQYDLTADHNALALECAKEGKDDTVFGLSGRRRLPGMLATRFGHAGYWNADAGTIDPVYFAAWGIRNSVMTVAPVATEGLTAYALRAVVADYTPFDSTPVDETLRFAVAGESDDVTVRGILAQHLIAATGTQTSTAVQLGELAAGQTLYVALHITAITASDVDVNVRSDDNSGMTTPATQVSSLNHATTGVVWDTTVTGPLAGEDWWDVQTVITGGTVSLAVFLGIQ